MPPLWSDRIDFIKWFECVRRIFASTDIPGSFTRAAQTDEHVIQLKQHEKETTVSLAQTRRWSLLRCKQRRHVVHERRTVTWVDPMTITLNAKSGNLRAHTRTSEQLDFLIMIINTLMNHIHTLEGRDDGPNDDDTCRSFLVVNWINSVYFPVKWYLFTMEFGSIPRPHDSSSPLRRIF